MRYILIDVVDIRDNYNDISTFDDLEQLANELKNRALEYRDDSYGFENWQKGLSVFEVGEKVNVTVTSGDPVVSLGVATTIPAPLPGESVSDYARRITGA